MKKRKEETRVHVNLVKLKNVNGIERFYYAFKAVFSGPDAGDPDGRFYYHIKGHAFKDDPLSSDILFSCTTPGEAWAFMLALQGRLEADPPYLYDFSTFDLISPEGIIYPGGVAV